MRLKKNPQNIQADIKTVARVYTSLLCDEEEGRPFWISVIQNAG